MKNKKGQSLIEIVFSIGVVTLVLTGVVTLVINTANSNRVLSEREKAVELSQVLIENKVLEIKNDPLTFWNSANSLDGITEVNKTIDGFTGYLYDVEYKSCNNNSCNIVFSVRWGNSQTLSVERFFSRIGT